MINLILQSQPHPESNDYANSTLPLTKREKKHHHSQDSRPLGPVPRVLNPLQHPSSNMGRRASIASPYNSPEHQTLYQPGRDPVLSHYYHQQTEKKISRGRRLPSTPSEEPYRQSLHTQEPSRSHSRADSMPDPLPMPWRHNIAPITQLAKSTAVQQAPLLETSPRTKSRSTHRKNGKHVTQNDSVAHQTEMKQHIKKNALKPIRPKSHSLGSKSFSQSVDANLHTKVEDVSHQHTRSVMWPAQTQVGTLQKMSTNGRKSVNIGWGSANNIHNKKALPGKLGKDIQGLMEERSAPPTAYSSIRDIPQEFTQPEESGSIVSVDIQPELFKPRHHELHTDKSQHQHRSHIISGDNLKVDPISGSEVAHFRNHPRQLYPKATSAKQSSPINPRQRPTTSYTSPTDKMHGLHYHSNGDIHQYDHDQVQTMCVCVCKIIL